MFIPIESKFAEESPSLGLTVRGIGAAIRCMVSSSHVLVWKRLSRTSAIDRMREHGYHYPSVEYRSDYVSWTYVSIKSDRLPHHPVYLYQPLHIENVVSLVVDGMSSWILPFTLFHRPRRMKAVYQSCFAGPLFY